MKQVRYSDVQRGRTKPGAFSDKIVVVGATASILQDLHPTSTTGDGPWPVPRSRPTPSRPRSTGFPLKESAARAGRAPDRPDGTGSAGGQPPPVGAQGARRSRSEWGCSTRRSPARIQRRHDPAVRVSARGARPLDGRGAGGLLRDRGLRARAHPRHVRALRARVGGGPGARADRRPAPGRRRSRGDGDVQRPARLHELRRVARARPGHRDPQPLPHRDGRRRHPAARRHAGGLHGRRHHGRVRRADPDGRPRRPRPGGRARQARGAGEVQRVAARGATASRSRSAWASGSTPAGHVRQRGLRAAAGLHRDRRHHQHRGAARGHDQGHALHALHVRLHPGRPQRRARRPGVRRRVRGPRAGADGEDLVGGPGGGRGGAGATFQSVSSPK